MEHPSYKTLRSDFEAVGEIEDRRSRFIAQLAHTESEDDAHAFIAAVRSRHGFFRTVVSAALTTVNRHVPPVCQSLRFYMAPVLPTYAVW